MGIRVIRIQRQLAVLGFDPGAIDGIRGRRTIGAIKAFQRKRGLEVDGLVGPKTAAVLFASEPEAAAGSIDAAPWLDYVEHLRGLHEDADNARLRKILHFDPAEIPWCAGLMASAVASTMPDEPLPNNPLGSINWLKFGKECKPQLGAILVFWRGSPNGWAGHIGIYVGEDGNYFHVLGGNQRDSINVSRIAKRRLRDGGCRWPATALAAVGGRVLVDDNGVEVTTNEA
ncbi:peptidoglycan-binding protein [Breoghania sp.]|uniref:NlpC/P60 family protein n=1 Tax=Breoghania sp. TaxID=2065378 RepID=UPI002AA65F2E|nr:peptidoglycan-binding protein [Breoghania sp.]